MPLDGDDELGVFAIMVPQKSDRSLNGLQSYRPYESKDNSDEIFANDYIVLTHRNPQRSAEILATVLEVLPEQKRADTDATRGSAWDTNDVYGSSTLPNTPTTEILGSTMQSLVRIKAAEYGLRDDMSSLRKRRKVSITAPHKQDATEDDYKNSDDGHIQLDARHVSEVSFSFSNSGPRAAQRQLSLESPSLRLTDEQADRIHVSWSVKDQETEYEFIYTMAECKSFAGLLAMLEEDTEAIPAIGQVLKSTKIWCLSYCVGEGDGASKALVTRRESEAPFTQLQTALAQAPLWSTSLPGRVRVELKSLSRPDSACAA